MSRTRAREVAMKMAFATMLGGDGNCNTILKMSNEGAKFEEKDIEFLKYLILGVEKNVEEIDFIIDMFSHGWAVGRFSNVDLCILRIAIFEAIKSEETPASVAINEAVELAKTFGGDKSSAFINGILGACLKKVELDEHSFNKEVSVGLAQKRQAIVEEIQRQRKEQEDALAANSLETDTSFDIDYEMFEPTSTTLQTQEITEIVDEFELTPKTELID